MDLQDASAAKDDDEMELVKKDEGDEAPVPVAED